MVQRLTYRTRNTYNTESNRRKVVKTPGGRLVYHRLKKPGQPRICSETRKKLHGIPALRDVEYGRIAKHRRTVARPYGGNLAPKVVRDKILRAFLIEERRCVEAVLQEKRRQKKAADQAKKSKKRV